MSIHRSFVPILFTCVGFSHCGATLFAAPDAAALKFFENEIRPLLAESCYDCHGPEKQKHGLRVDNLPYLLQGGESGAALVPGKPEESILLDYLSYKDSDHEMPPEGKLPEAKIEAIRKWIAMGAPWPEAEVAAAKVSRKPGEFTKEDREWWAFQPLKVVAPPSAKKGVVFNPVDAFVQAKLAENGLTAAPEATPEELIRRVTFDLTGLPPAPEEVAAFVSENAAERGQTKTKKPSAYERMVDRLLASPRYGERWAQHWLDVVRYAESEGYRQDAYRPNVWPYRDWVIKSLNNDKPYDQFVREQIAGDEMSPDDPEVVIGTAFLRHTIYEYNQRDAEGQLRGILNEVTDVTADVFMGLSVQCAQCHDHKFDPILHKDYYRLQAFLTNTTWPDEKPLATPEEKLRYDEQMKIWEEATKEPRAIIDAIVEPKVKKAQENAMEKFPAEVYAMYLKSKDQRTPYEEQVVQLAWKQAVYERVRLKTDKLKEPEATQLREARELLATFDHLKPKPLVTAFVIGETGRRASPKTFTTRKSGQVTVEPGFLTILDPKDAVIPPVKSGSATTTGRRTVLADWLTRPDNPLTTRVIVNRIWQYHFGRGIVATPSDFGRLGEKPMHPELLDWLTTEFVRGGWKMKPLHKLILMSATYRQTARREPSATELTVDPENRLLWRFLPRRLDAEQSRDAVLAVSGELDEKMFGEGVDAGKPRRSVYTRRMRNTQDDFLKSLDQPPGFSSVPTRDSTTTATQSLLMINGDWPLDRAKAMASRLLKDRPGSDSDIVRRAYSLAFSRSPSKDETLEGARFLTEQRKLLQKEAPPASAEEPALADATRYFGPSALSKTAKALRLQPGTKNEKLRVHESGRIEGDEFAIEAVVHLESLYPNAAVRTIVSRWDNSKTERGWSLGVTSEKSAYKPNNLIVQLSGDDFQGSLMYEVVASGLQIPVGKPYYVAAAINDEPVDGQKFGGTVTFYARDLSDPAAPMQTVTVPHQVCGGYVNGERRLYVGGREKDKGSLWHGAIARVVVRHGALDGGRLMSWVGATDANCIVDVNADQVSEMVKGNPATAWRWESSATTPSAKGAMDPSREAVADLCHILLNSNEFFFIH